MWYRRVCGHILRSGQCKIKSWLLNTHRQVNQPQNLSFLSVKWVIIKSLLLKCWNNDPDDKCSRLVFNKWWPTSDTGIGSSLACVPEVIQVMILSTTTLMCLFCFMTRLLLRDYLEYHRIYVHFSLRWQRPSIHAKKQCHPPQHIHFPSWKIEDNVDQIHVIKIILSSKHKSMSK